MDSQQTGREIAMSVEARIAEMGLVLPEAAAPVASYVPTVEADNMLYVSGQIRLRPERTLFIE